MTTFRWILGALGAAALAVPAAASAQDYETDYDQNWDGSESQVETNGNDGTRVTTTEQNGDLYAERERERRGQDDDRGVEVQAQGGVLAFPGEAASQLTPGANYGVVVGIEPGIGIFELELGYQGAAYQTDESLTGAQENAIENGGQALVKLSPKVGAIEPYAFGGYQLSRFNVYERDNSTGALDDATINKAPVGAGVDFHLGDVLVGARGTYNFVFDNDFLTEVDDNRSADQVGGSLLIGGQF